MTNGMTVRLDPGTERKLEELAQDTSTKTEAVKAAIETAWRQRQERLLEEAYAHAVADNPNYPYEDDTERTASRQRRAARASEATT
ncbi:hypothetical protein [Saccharomonospora iraqiensis]|uniref:hypothetical protein n=1 Tax=Saccharomonospora iraqiensis TaxID=52698 RepID=UPI0004247D6E|nr:hypothetical protein [Saccharomonospora iraqiensis]